MNYKEKIKALGGEEFLTEADIDDFLKAEGEILRFMLDERIHDKPEIVDAGFGQDEALRRMRNLRKLPFVEEVKTLRPNSDHRHFAYQLVLAPGWRTRSIQCWVTGVYRAERGGQGTLF